MIKLLRKKNFKLRLNKTKINGPKEAADACPKSNKNSMFTAQFHEINSLLYTSGYRAAQDSTLLKNFKIDHVINLTAHKCANIHPNSVSYSSFEFSDNSQFNLKDKLMEVIQIIAQKIQNKERVLVHCQMGISRAPSVVMGYLIKFEDKSFNTALEEVRLNNPNVCPNIGFLMQLQNL